MTDYRRTARSFDRRTLFKATGTVALGAGLGGLAGCSSGSDSNELSFMYWGSSYEQKAVQQMLQGFTAKTHVQTKPIFVTGDYTTKVNTLVASHSTPDVAYMGGSMGYRLAQQGKLVNIYSYFKKYPELAERLPQTYFWWGKDKCFGTQTANEIIVTYYSKKAFTQAGVDLPPATAQTAWSWDDFVATAAKLTIDDDGTHADELAYKPTKAKQFGVSLDLTYQGVWYPLLLSNGGDVVDKAGRTCTLDSPESIQVFQNLQDLIYKHHVAPTPSQLGNNAPTTQVQLQTGRMAMVLDGQWSLLDIAAAGVDYGIGVLPRYQKPMTMSLGGASVIFTSSKHPKEALELYLFHNDPKHVDLYKDGLWMPMDRSYYTDPKLIDSWTKNSAHPPEYKTAVVDYTLNNSVTDWNQRIKNDDNIAEVLTPALQQIATGKTPAKDVLQKVAPKITQRLQGWYPTQQP